MMNIQIQSTKKYDLEERTFEFGRKCRELVKRLHPTTGNIEDGKQLIRSSGSQAANYIEANESLSRKDFVMRIKICRKESKESRLWLRLCEVGNNKELEKERLKLIQEATELIKIFHAIIEKSKQF